ncbi:hypothetical protein L4D21_07970 [Photobacterium profundum]|uniref:hypothetical protein n=1 Tax=Photobacterium profundum TaxID=74109 RepID=UPI003D151D78
MKYLVIALLCALVVSMTDIHQPYERLIIRTDQMQVDTLASSSGDLSLFVKQEHDLQVTLNND